MRHVEPAQAVLDWKQFLQFGEELFSLPNTAAQCQLILQTVQEKFSCQADIWMAEPFYPLPGEPEVKILQHVSDLPFPAMEAFTSHKPTYLEKSGSISSEFHPQNLPVKAAFPLLAQDNVLGVLWVENLPCDDCLNEQILYLEGLAAHMALTLQIFRQVTIKNWRNEQLSLVRSVSNQIVTMQNLTELCTQVTGLIQKTFHYYYVAIFTREKEPQELVFRASASMDQAWTDSGKITRLAGHGMIGYVARTGEELIAPNVQVDAHYLPVDSLPETRSELVIPLKVDDAVLGVLDVQSNQPDAFHENDLLVLRALADNITLAIQETRLYHDLKKRAEDMRLVFEFSRALTSILEMDKLLDEIVNLIHNHFNYPFVHVFTVHPARHKVIYETGSGARSQHFHELDIQYNLDDPEGLIPYVARSGVTKMVNDVRMEAHYKPSPLPPDDTGSELAIPIKLGNEILGVLDIQSTRTGAFTEADCSLLEALGASIAIALRNATLYRSEKWRRQVSDSFRDVAILVSANTALDKLLDTILLELERNLPCDASAIWLLNDSYKEGDDRRQLYLAAVHGLDPQSVLDAMNQSADLKQWLALTFQAQEPIIRGPGDPFGPLGLAGHFSPDYSSIAAPLRAGERILGVLSLAHNSQGRYGNETRILTTTFSSYAAVAIQNGRLFAEAQDRAWTSTLLLQVSEATQSLTTIEELLSTTVRLLPLLMGVKTSVFFLWDEDEQVFRTAASHGIDLPDSLSLREEPPALLELRLKRQPVFLQNPGREFPALAGITDKMILIPMLSRSSLLGALMVSYQPDTSPVTARGDFLEQSMPILQGLVHQTAVALENLRLIEARQEEAYVTAVLLQVAEAVVSQNELNDILDTIMHILPILVGIDVAVIYTFERQKELFKPIQAFAGSHQVEKTILDQSFCTEEFPLLDAVRDGNRPFFGLLPTPEFQINNWLALDTLREDEFPPVSGEVDCLNGFPLFIKNDFFGVMVTQEKVTSRRFHNRRMEIINGVAQQVSLAMQNEVFNLEKVNQERVEREFQLARQIQETFLPTHLPKTPGWEVDARWQTARQVGGDFYDVIRLNNHRLGLVIADVSDKGMPAALYMTVTRTLIRANAQDHQSPAALLEKVNQLLITDSQNSLFVTAVYAVLNLKTGELTYANAGHNRPLLIQSATGEITPLPKGGLALGILENIHLQEYQFTLHPGDNLVLYTDGVTETFSPLGEPFGEKNLTEILTHYVGKDICDLVHDLDTALTEFRAGAAPSDDVTILGIRRIPAPQLDLP